MKKLSVQSLVHALILSVCLFLLTALISFYGVYLYIAPSVPDIASLKSRMIEMPLSVYSRDGKLIGVFGEKLSSPVTYRQIPPDFVHAFLAAEDASFFEHSGISFKGLGRAISEAIQNTGRQTGGSTITMQVAKNFYLSPERTIKRKLTEVVLARKIEQNLTKKEIFTLYVNKIFFGQHAYGIAAASKVYFNKRLDQLTIAEMAMIAGLPKAPSKYNPVVNPARALERRNWILGRMLQLGYITPRQYKTAINSPITLKTTNTAADVPMPYLAEMVRNEMIARFGPDVLNMGWRVYTTVDSNRQQMADRALRGGLEDYDRRHGYRGAEGHNIPLSDFYPVNDWQPAQVLSVEPGQFTALLKNDEQVNVPFSSMGWARKYINANVTGPFPAKAADVVKPGDIVRIKRDPESKTWKFGQIPRVQGQLVAMNPTNGALEALVGGYHYGSSRFNRSTQGWRQAGSTIKPFIYTLALERGFTPYSTVYDSPLTIGRWSPQNSDGAFRGAMPLRTALYLSRNLVSVRLLQAVGIGRARQFLEEFGFIPDKLPANLTLALGTAQVVPVQIATGYSAFANGGRRIQPYFIQEIDAFDGKKLYEANPPRVCSTCVITVNKDGSPPTSIKFNEDFPQAPQIVKPTAAYDMANILRDVVQHGTARKALSLGRDDVGGKTGTTNDAKDAWFAGLHPSLVAVSWVGFDQPQTLGKTEFGGVAALPIWINFMEQALQNTPRQWVINPRAPAAGDIEESRGFDVAPRKPKAKPSDNSNEEPVLIQPADGAEPVTPAPVADTPAA